MSRRTPFDPRSSEGGSWSDLDPIKNPPTPYYSVRSSSAGPSTTVDPGHSRPEASSSSSGHHQAASSGSTNFATESGEAGPGSLNSMSTAAFSNRSSLITPQVCSPMPTKTTIAKTLTEKCGGLRTFCSTSRRAQHPKSRRLLAIIIATTARRNPRSPYRLRPTS